MGYPKIIIYHDITRVVSSQIDEPWLLEPDMP